VCGYNSIPKSGGGDKNGSGSVNTFGSNNTGNTSGGTKECLCLIVIN